MDTSALVHRCPVSHVSGTRIQSAHLILEGMPALHKPLWASLHGAFVCAMQRYADAERILQRMN